MKRTKLLSLVSLFFVSVVSFAGNTTNKPLQKLTHPQTLNQAYSKASSIFTPKKEHNYYWDMSTNTWFFTDTTIYTYDSKAHVMTALKLDQTGANLSLTTNQYNSSGLLTNALQQSWDVNTNSWMNSFQTKYTYDSHQNETLFQQENWDQSTNSWMISSGTQTVYVYNTNGLPTSITYSNYDLTLLTYVPYSRSINQTYNSANEITSEQHDTYDNLNTIWVPSQLYNYTYNNQNKLITLLISNSNGSGGWDYFMRASNILWYQWNGNLDNSLIQSYLLETYNLMNMTWEASSRETYNYTSNNSYVGIEETYNGTTWENSAKLVTTNDSHNNQILNEYYQWDATTNAWLMNSGWQYNFTYNGQGATTEKVTQYYDNISLLAYVNSNRTIYEDFIEFNWATSISNIAVKDASIFPNPSQDKFTIKLNQASALQIYNMLGELMFSDSKVSQVEVDCSNWPSSTYVIQVQNPNEGSFTKKFIKN